MFEVRQLTGDDAKREALLEILAETPGPGIVYTATVRAVEQVTEELRLAGHDVARYHGRLPKRERTTRRWPRSRRPPTALRRTRCASCSRC